MAKNVFITGSNGFLGRNMLEHLMGTDNDKFYLLVRSDASKNSVLEHINRNMTDKIEFLYGDLTLPLFGLKNDDLEKVITCEDLWHFAAATTFDDKKKDLIRTTNIGGAENIIKVAKDSKNLKHLYFISTAYIAGRNKDVIYEDKMPVVTDFKNSYEESKYQSEIIVRSSDLPWTILRPSIVVGNSKTYSCQGETRMIYGYILGVYTALLGFFKKEDNFINAWKNKEYPYVLLRMKGCYGTRKNFICIDDVVGIISDIIAGDCIGKTFNITGNHIVGKNISDAFNDGLRVKGIEYVGKEVSQPSKIERLAHRFTSAFDEYCINDDPDWDTTNTDKALKNHRKVEMTKELFYNLIENFIEKEIIEKALLRKAEMV